MVLQLYGRPSPLQRGRRSATLQQSRFHSIRRREGRRLGPETILGEDRFRSPGTGLAAPQCPEPQQEEQRKSRLQQEAQTG
jgi:hypothetical protein